MTINKKLSRSGGFSLLEVIVAMAIALLVLTALMSLEMKSSAVAADTSRSFESLPLAIERIEELSETGFTGAEQKEYVDDYEVVTSSKDVPSAIPVTRIQVEVLRNGEYCSELSLYKFRI